MKFKKQATNDVTCEPDMTPMIDMTFQLIAFFMVLLNFGEGEQDQSIKLPSSELAKPPEVATEAPIVLQLTERNTVLMGGDELPVSGLTAPLARERAALQARQISPSDATIFIRADINSKTGVVQEMIQQCQTNGFEKFALRAKSEAR
jgi:biopolymer transport protein ExbD